MPVDPYGRQSPSAPVGVPYNTALWAQIRKEAQVRFHPFPSIPAARWMHNEYIKRGGTFVEKESEDMEHRGKSAKKRHEKATAEAREKAKSHQSHSKHKKDNRR